MGEPYRGGEAGRAPALDYGEPQPGDVVFVVGEGRKGVPRDATSAAGHVEAAETSNGVTRYLLSFPGTKRQAWFRGEELRVASRPCALCRERCPVCGCAEGRGVPHRTSCPNLGRIAACPNNATRAVDDERQGRLLICGGHNDAG